MEQIIKKGLFKNNNVSWTVYLEKFNAWDNSTNKQLSEIRINGKFSNSVARVVYDGAESVNSLTLNNGWFRTEVVKWNDFAEPWSSLVIKIELDGGDEYYGAAIDYSPNNN